MPTDMRGRTDVLCAYRALVLSIAPQRTQRILALNRASAGVLRCTLWDGGELRTQNFRLAYRRRASRLETLLQSNTYPRRRRMIAVATLSSVAGDSGHSLSPGIRTLSLLSSRT